MKKAFMLMMAAVLIGLVGCGSEPQVNENLPTPTEKVEEVVAASTETPVPTATTAPTETPVPTPTVAATPFPSPTPVIEEESEVTDEVIDYKIDPKTGEKIPVYATPTPEITEETKAPTVKIYGEIHAQENHLTPGVFSMYFTFYFADNDTTYRTQSIPLTLEEYNIASACQSALVEVYADESGEAARPWNSILYMEWLSYEFVTE